MGGMVDKNGGRAPHYYRRELNNHATLLNALREAQPDVVFHLAANCDIPKGTKNPYVDIQDNVYGTFNVLDCMRILNLRQLVFSSTAAVYGDTDTVHHEKEAPLYPISLYGASKYAAEALISGFSQMYGIHARIFRFGNVIGGGMDHGVIFDLITRAKADPDRLTVWGNGKGFKPFFLVEDCVWGMMCVLSAMESTAGSTQPCDIFNLGSEGVTSIAGVAEMVLEELDQAGKEIVYGTSDRGFNGDVRSVRLDTTKVQVLGWRPSVGSTAAVRIAAQRIIKELQ